MHVGEQYAGGLHLDFFPNAEFEPMDSDHSDEHSLSLVRNLLRIIMMGWRDNWTDLISISTLRSILIERDPELTRNFRLAFQQGFNHVFTQLETSNLSQEQLNQAQLYINNCLMFLPYADPNPYESFSIPQWINGHWEMVDYKVTPIELTPPYGVKKLFIPEEDRIFAYGLEPIANSEADPHLLFMGTTYPGGQGFFSTIRTDLQAFETAGKNLYRSGRDNIQRWLDTQGKKVHVAGTSLGGALSLLLAIDQGDKLSRVDALNPPGLYSPIFRQSRFDRWDELEEQPEVFIQRQGNDPVSKFGVWKKEWHLLHARPAHPRLGVNAFTDHGLNYAGFADTTYTVIDTVRDSMQNERRNFWLYTVLRSLTYYTLLVPHHYLLRPLFRLVWDHKLQSSFFFPLLLLAFLGGDFTSTPLSLMLFGVGALSYCLKSLLEFINFQIRNNPQMELSKFLNSISLREWVNAIFITGAMAIGASIAGISMMVALAITIPFAIAISQNVIHMIQVVFGYEKASLLHCHHPNLQRVVEMDIHSKVTEAEFTHEELLNYEVAKAILKGEEPNFTKTEDSAAEEMVKHKGTQADIHHIKRMARLGSLASKFGIYAVKQEIDTTYESYKQGCSLHL